MHCAYCGMKFADDDKFCPNCGARRATEAKKHCRNCGAVLEVGEVYCGKCGTSSISGIAKPAFEKKYNNFKQSIKENNNKNYLNMAAIIVVIILLIIGYIIQISIFNKYSMQNAVHYMQVGGLKAEDMCNTYNKVWYNAIVNHSVTIDGNNYEDFNDALAAQSQVYQKDGSYNTLKDNISKVNGYINKMYKFDLKNKEQYDDVMKMYSDYSDLTNSALNPTGSLETYHEKIMDADNKLASELTAYTSKYQSK